MSFIFGDLRLTIVSDGQIKSGSLRSSLRADPRERLTASELDTQVVLDINLLVVEGDDLRVLLDAGVGTGSDLGPALFGDSVGRGPAGLRHAGIDPSSIDIVALSHAHPDHAWGLVGDDLSVVFPRAQIVVGQTELSYWLGEGPAAPAAHNQARMIRDGARRSLRAYGGSVLAVDDGYRLTPSIVAREFPGHSPGHLVFELSSMGRKLCCWGDICHHPVLVSAPELNFVFDHDTKAATHSRLRLFESLAGQEIDVLSYHFPFPGLGRLIGSSQHGYAWRELPIEAG